MPTIYRVMKRENSQPVIGDTATSLGVRVPKDIKPDDQGNVHPDTHGMSVAPTFETLPFMLVPRRLNHTIRGAVGSNNAQIWKMGEGTWSRGPVAPDLQLELDPAKPETHGLVSPDRSMALEDYRTALAATQDSWSLVPEPPAS